MKSTYFYKGALALAILGLASCKPTIDTPAPNKGTADFTRYIALGNSLTAGFSDAGLYLEGQKNSYPEMIATQMKAVGGGSFSTPFFPESQFNGSGYLKLTALVNGVPTIVPETSNLAIRGQVGGVNLYTKYTGNIENFGIPGIQLAHVKIPGYGTLNNYYERLLTDATINTPYLDFVTAKPWTFFSNWLGNNDILGYASAGATGTSPTPKGAFASQYAEVITKLTSTGAKGVVATVPDVTKIAYFNTVTLQTLLAAINATPTGKDVKDIYIQTGAGTSRPATVEDLFTLTLNSAGVMGKPNNNGIPYGLHPANPVESKYVLDKSEIEVVNDFITSYNTSIKDVANAKGLAIMDAHSMLNEYGAGKMVNGIPVSAAFIRGNLFSLDGTHLTPLGYAITANAFIAAINAKYGSSIPVVDVSKYRGVKFP
ncbi:SGNH/GDSL hydrolase family protein [Pedobacter sp. ASV1-7]|uniref:SGNH/GDSL hydrolase family protein n=1 Tax=Pedobacter sp. ASV1-7 TaxID=3145237 RepID=UPI0032E87E6E